MAPHRLAAIALGLALLSAGCADRVAGGTSETENMVGSRLLDVDSLLSDWALPDTGATVAILRLDSSNFPFSRSTSDGRDIAIERLDGARIPMRIVVWDRTASRARIEARLGPSLTSPGARIRLVWGLPDSLRTDSTAVWTSIPESLRASLTSVLVDDFEHTGLVAPFADSAWWYTFPSDSTTTVSEPSIVPGEGRSGNALHMTYTPPAPDAGFAYAGVSLVRPRTLRSLDSVVFWAKGPGNLEFAFDKLGTNAGKAQTGRILDSGWTRIVVRPRELDAADGIGGNVGWEKVRDSVTNLTFFISHGAGLWLDDIRLHGVNRDDLR